MTHPTLYDVPQTRIGAKAPVSSVESQPKFGLTHISNFVGVTMSPASKNRLF